MTIDFERATGEASDESSLRGAMRVERGGGEWGRLEGDGGGWDMDKSVE